VAVPTINVTINFSTGPSFAQAFIIGSGIFGVNVLADNEAVIVDVSNQVDKIDTVRGRNAQADQFQTGQLSLRIVDMNGDFNPQNPSSPYAGLLNPMRKVQITATWNSVTYPIFSGFITGYSTTTPKDTGEVVYTTITAVDAFRLAQNAQVSTVTDAGAGQLSGTRINKILDQIGWPASMRDVDAGQTTLIADPGTPRTALQAMQTVEISEYGSLYVNASGEFVFQDRIHSYNQQNLLMETDAVALDYARAYVASRAETTTRCDAITLDLYTADYNAGIIAALDLDFFDPVTITTTQPGSSALTKTLQVFGVAHSITPNSWKTQFTTLEPIIDGFILDSTLYGILGTSVLSY